MFLASQAFIAAISLLIAYGIASKQYIVFAIIPLVVFIFVESLLICSLAINLSSKEASETVLKLAKLAGDESLFGKELSGSWFVIGRSLVGSSIIITIIGFYSVFSTLGAYFFMLYVGLWPTVSIALLYIILFCVGMLSGRQVLAHAFKRPKSS